MKVVRIVAALLLMCAVVIGARAPVAKSFPIPGIPGVPGANPQSIAINAAERQLAPWVKNNQPVIRDWSAVFPTVVTLPGRPFSPIGVASNRIRASLLGQLTHSSTGVVRLPSGDYRLETRVYCTDIHRHAGHRALWILGPLRGSRAGVLAAMYARASGKNVPFSNLQSLSWALQAGMRYDELNPNQQQLVNQLIPDLRGQIAGSFMDQVQGQWNTISSTVPGVPSLDSAVGRMGDTGQTILTIRDARNEILANANNFDVLSRTLAPPGGQDDQNAGDPPWSIVTAQVYERIITPGHFGADSELQIRVVGRSATGVLVPLTNVISYPPNHTDWQPLTYESPALVIL